MATTARMLRRHTSSPELRSFFERVDIAQLQSASEVMLESYLKNHLAVPISASAPKTVFAALARKREPVDLSIGSTLQFIEGRITRGNAKEIFLGLVHGQYSDEEYLDLVEDFLNIQDLIIPSKELLTWMMDTFFEEAAAKCITEDVAMQNSNAKGNLGHSLPQSSSQLPSIRVQSTDTLQAKIIQTKSKASLALPLDRRDNLQLNTNNSTTQSPRTNAEPLSVLTTSGKRISPLTSPIHTARRAIAASNSVVVGRRVTKPSDLNRTVNTSLRNVHDLDLRKSPERPFISHAPTAPPSTRAPMTGNSFAKPQSALLNQPASQCDDGSRDFHVSPVNSDFADPSQQQNDLFIDKQSRVLFLLENWLDLSSAEVSNDESLALTVRNFASDIAYRSKFKPEGLKLLSLLQDVLLLQKLAPGSHFSVKGNIGRIVARMIATSKLVQNDIVVVKEIIIWLCSRLDIEAKQANILLNRSHAASFTQKVADRPDFVRMLPPFDSQSQRSVWPTPNVTVASGADLLAIDPLLIAEAFTAHEAKLFARVLPSELTCVKRGPRVGAMLEWEQRLGEKITAQVRTRSQDKKARLDAVVHALKIARTCLEAHRNFQAAFAIWKALNADELCRKLLSEHEKAGGRGLIELLRLTTDPTDDHASYRSRLANLQPPAVPYLPFVLSDITRVEEELAEEVRQLARQQKENQTQKNNNVSGKMTHVENNSASSHRPRNSAPELESALNRVNQSGANLSNSSVVVVSPPSPILSFEKLRALAQIRAYISSFQASCLYYDIPTDRTKILEPIFGTLL